MPFAIFLILNPPFSPRKTSNDTTASTLITGITIAMATDILPKIEKGELKFEDYSYFGNLSQYEKMMVDTLRKEGMSDKEILESLKVM